MVRDLYLSSLEELNVTTNNVVDVIQLDEGLILVFEHDKDEYQFINQPSSYVVKL